MLENRPDFTSTVAKATIIITPLLAFRVLEIPVRATAGLLPVCVVLLATYLRSPRSRAPVWELALLGVLALSVIWGDVPAYTAAQLRTYLVLVIAAVLAASVLPAADILTSLRWSFLLLVSSSLLYLALDPATRSRLGSADLVLTAQFSKNTYGGLLVIALILVLERPRRLNLLLVPGLGLMIAFNQSVTAWLTAGFLIIISLSSRRILRTLPRSTAVPVLTTMVSVGFGAVGLLLATGVDTALGVVGKDPTLGRRTQIWAACWEQIQAAPLLGHGAFTFLSAASQSPVTQFVWSKFQGYQPPHPHNGLIDLAGQIGLVGVVAYAGLMFSGIARGLKPALEGNTPARVAVLSLVFILLFGFTEPTYLGPWLVLTACFAAMTDHRHTPTPLPPLRAALPEAVAAHGGSAW